MNINMRGFLDSFQKTLNPFALDESSLTALEGLSGTRGGRSVTIV